MADTCSMRSSFVAFVRAGIMGQIISYRVLQQQGLEHLTSVGRVCGCASELSVCVCVSVGVEVCSYCYPACTQSSTRWLVQFRFQFRFYWLKNVSSLSVWKNVANCVCAAGRVDTCLVVAPTLFLFLLPFPLPLPLLFPPCWPCWCYHLVSRDSNKIFWLLNCFLCAFTLKLFTSGKCE